jgi:nitroreductase
LELLVEAALRSPSSMGNNPWEFVIVTDPDVLEKLSKAKPHGATFLKKTALGIIVCADPKKSSVWIEDASIAAIYIHLAAESLGLGSCWIQIRDRMHTEGISAGAYISEILDIPGNLKVEAMIAIGHSAEKIEPHPEETLQYQKVFFGAYGRPYRG